MPRRPGAELPAAAGAALEPPCGGRAGAVRRWEPGPAGTAWNGQAAASAVLETWDTVRPQVKRASRKMEFPPWLWLKWK